MASVEDIFKEASKEKEIKFIPDTCPFYKPHPWFHFDEKVSLISFWDPIDVDVLILLKTTENTKQYYHKKQLIMIVDGIKLCEVDFDGEGFITFVCHREKVNNLENTGKFTCLEETTSSRFKARYSDIDELFLDLFDYTNTKALLEYFQENKFVRTFRQNNPFQFIDFDLDVI